VIRTAGAGSGPIFILGITQRAGTHFVYDALLLHDDVAPTLVPDEPWLPSWEDHLLSESEHLAGYVERVRGRWNLADARNEETASRLWAAIGAGISSFLSELSLASGGSSHQRPVTKTPTLENLGLIDRLFPSSPVVVVVRDPRAVLVSSMASFGGTPERWIRHWKRMAATLVEFMDRHPDRLTVVRYEELFLDATEVMKQVLTDLELDPGRYAFDRLQQLPVRGSSELRASGMGGWSPVPRPAGFDPADRGRLLDAGVAERLQWLLEPELGLLGYAGEARPRTVRGAAYQRVLDARWSIGRFGRRALDRVRGDALIGGRRTPAKGPPAQPAAVMVNGSGRGAVGSAR